MFEIACPTCGNPVFFRRESSLYSVCDACGTILLRKDVNIQAIGKSADLQPDNTPLQVGTTGIYNNRAFEVLGRIQVRQEDGFWNEWYLGYQDGTIGWLGEALGEYFVSFEASQREAPKKDIPKFQHIGLNDKLNLARTTYYVTNKAKSIVCSYEGELPFIMTGSYELPYVDLRSHGPRAATIDYSEGEPLVFLGTYQEFQDFKFQNLRDPDDHVKRRSADCIQKFDCPSCGAPHTLGPAGPQTQSFICEYCGAGIDCSHSNQAKILFQNAQNVKNIKPIFSLGSKCKVHDIEWEVIGYQRKYSRYEGQTFYWEEYLCYERCHGYRYLIRTKGHWSWCNTLHELPSNPQDSESHQNVKGKKFKHFESYVGNVSQVIGEFPYKVDLQSKSFISDYICPPFGLSRECSQNSNNDEVYWSLSEYMESDDVGKAFGIKLKDIRFDIGSFQVNRHKATFWHTFLAASLSFVALLFLCLAMEASSKTICTKKFTIETYKDPSVLTDPFEITGRRVQPIQIELSSSDINNRWIYVDFALVNVDTHEAKLFSQSLSYYHGYSEGDHWTEGTKSGSIIVPSVKRGKYVLRLDTQTGTGNNPDNLFPQKSNDDHKSKPIVKLFCKVSTSPPYWLWSFIVFCCLILPVPCYYAYKWYSVEKDRWENSDHPWSVDDDDDDDDDDD